MSKKYESGDKFVVEIDEIYQGQVNLYRIKGFNSLVFDEKGLDKLQKRDVKTDELYCQGVRDGIKLALKTRNTNDLKMCSIFGHEDLLKLVDALPLDELVDKFQQVSRKFKIGDVVKDVESSSEGVVISTPDQNGLYQVYSSGHDGVLKLSEDNLLYGGRNIRNILDKYM